MNKKRLFSGISSAVLILGSLSPIQVFAQNEEAVFTETGNAEWNALGQGAQWKIDDKGILTIQGNYSSPMPTDDRVTSWPWYGRKEEVQRINFGTGFKVTGSCQNMFIDMGNLTSIDLNGLDTTEVTTMENMFLRCKALQKLDLTPLDTSNVTNMKFMFNGCNALSEIDLSKFDTTNVTTMDSMFVYCHSLKDLDVSSFNTSNVENMRFMFGYCSGLTDLILNNFSTENVKTMELMFYNCSALTDLNLSKLRVESVTNMKNMFGMCTMLEDLNLGTWMLNENVNTSGMFATTNGILTANKLNYVRLAVSGQDLLPALLEVNGTWHVEKTGPYNSAAEITKKMSEYRQNEGLPSVLLERRLKYSMDYYSQEAQLKHLATTKLIYSETGNCDFTVGTLVPERVGYTFLGWADTPNAAQAKYYAGDKITLDLNTDGQHKDLYAVWRRNSSSGSSSGSSSSGSVARSSVHEMHRMYNPNSGEHFYTKEIAERDHLVNVGWQYEGTAWYSPKSSGSPVYRLYNPNAGDHHYTLSAGERDELVRVGWKDEGIGWYSANSRDGQAVHRQYNPNAVAGSHNFTTDEYERDYLINNGWNHEGVAWYGVHPKNIKK